METSPALVGLDVTGSEAKDDVVGRERLVGRFIGTTGASGVIAVIGLVTGILGARLLGPDGRGQLAAIQMWPSTLATFAMLGLPDALVYYSARKPTEAGQHLTSSVPLAILAAAVFGAAGYVAMPTLLAAQSDVTVAVARWYLLLLIPLFALVGLPLHPLRGLNDFVSWNVLRVTPAAGWLAVLLVVWSIDRIHAAALAIGHLALLGVLIVPVWLTARQRISGSFRLNPVVFRPLLGYGLPSAAGAVPSFLAARLDQFVIAAFLPAPMLGFYAVAVGWGAATQLLLSALGAVALPHIAVQRTQIARLEAFVTTGRLATLISVMITGTLLCLTPPAIPRLFGLNFEEAVPVACLAVLASGIGAWNLALEEGFRGLGKPAVTLWAELGGLVVLACAVGFLAGPFGLFGVAGAAVGGRATTAVVLAAVASAVADCSPSAFLIPRRSELRAIAWMASRTR
jgi:O-antigen/teichoic acid export membrane protein